MKRLHLDYGSALCVGRFRDAGQDLTLDRTRADLACRVRMDSCNDEQRTVELSISSDGEVEVYPGEFEQLSHAPECVDMSRMMAGAPLLWNHDRNQQIGKLENVRIEGGKIRATARFGTSAKANEVWGDVKAGILDKTSVGFRVLDYTTSEREDNTTLYNVTRWLPFEGSIVTIPADISTGVNRADNNNKNAESNNMPRNNRYQRRFLDKDTGLNPPMPAPGGTPAPAVNVEHERQAAIGAERKRVSDIMTACKTFGGSEEFQQRAINDNLTLDQVREHLLGEVHKRNTELKQAGRPVGMNKKEISGFRFMKIFRALADPTNAKLREEAKMEFEACQAAADQITYRSVKGLVIPSDVLCAGFNDEEARALGTFRQRDNAISVMSGAGYTGTGANVIQTTLMASAFIEILRHKCLLMGLGTQLAGLVGNLEIPRMTSSQFGGGWVGEDDIAPNTQVDFDQVPLTVKTAAAYAYITRKMLTQPSIGMEALVRMDIAKKLAQKVDLGGFYGTGDKQPTGLKNTDGINAVAFAGANPTYAELVDMETRISLDDADVESMAYLANAAFRGYAKTALKFPGTAASGTIWEPGNMVNGYDCDITNQVTTGDVFLGNWADMLIGLWGGLEILADPYTKSTQGGILVSAFQDVDVAIRRPQSFCYGSNSATAHQA